MTPMHIQMDCLFCQKPLVFVPKHSGDMYFYLYTCRGCQSPNHQTLHRQLYDQKSKLLLSDCVQIDEYYITRYYRPTSIGYRYNYSVIFKEALGILDGCSDMEPISLNKPVCEVNHIIDLPTKDLENLKHRLDIWTTFS